MLETYIAQLGRALEIPIPANEKEVGSYTFSLDGQECVIKELSQTQQCEVRATICPVPHQNQEALFTKMLLGNLFSQGTRGSVLGLSSDGSKLVLILRKPLPAKYEEFYRHIEDFMNVVDMWKSEAEQAA